MRTKLAVAAFFVLISILSGCAGVGAITTSDPARKLHDATYFLDEEDRPLIAERLIRESIGIYKEKNDTLGLAEAYRVYGLFFRSPSVAGKSSTHYREYGFLDRSATFETRLDKAIEYLTKSREHYFEHERFDALTNVDLNIGLTYAAMHNLDAACKAFDQSVVDFRENIRKVPDARPVIPQGYSSYDEFATDLKKRQGCP